MVKQDVLEAIARLSKDSDFIVFVDEVRRRREEERNAFEVASSLIEAGRRSGASAFASDLLTLVEDTDRAIKLARTRQ